MFPVFFFRRVDYEVKILEGCTNIMLTCWSFPPFCLLFISLCRSPAALNWKCDVTERVKRFLLNRRVLCCKCTFFLDQIWNYWVVQSWLSLLVFVSENSVFSVDFVNLCLDGRVFRREPKPPSRTRESLCWIFDGTNTCEGEGGLTCRPSSCAV